MRFMHRFLVLPAVAWCVVASAADQPEAGSGNDPEGIAFFESKIRPVLVRECYECHAADSKAIKGGLRLDTRQATHEGGDSGPAIVPGSPEESTLLSAIRYEDFRMPPKRKLPETVAADFERWIRMGAPDPRDSGKPTKPETSAETSPAAAADFWAFRPPVSHEPPGVADESWVLDPLDRFVLAKLEDKSLKPAAPADRRTWLRRVSFDLTGLPPTPEDVARFEADTSPAAFEKVVDRLLASPAYGERWGRHWLDLARYAEDQAHTFKARLYPNGYLYRDWVVRALNDDMPYDRFLKYQIAGDLIDMPDAHAHRAALGLFALGPVYYQDNGEKDKALADEWDDRLDTLMRGTQAMTVACARCHDHKYDPISTADYYGLAGVFASSEYAELPAVANEVVEARRQADQAAAEARLRADRFLAANAAASREKLIDRIPDYAEAGWKLARQAKGEKVSEQALKSAARRSKLSPALLARWAKGFEPAFRGAKPNPRAIEAIKTAIPQMDPLAAFFAEFELRYPFLDLDQPGREAEAAAALAEMARKLQAEARAALPRRQEFVAEYGENFAFVPAESRATVVPGEIPLGNLFDDPKDASLRTAIRSDPFRAEASKESLGVERVLLGWGDTAQIAPDIRVAFGRLGSGKEQFGPILNDACADSGILTRGKPVERGGGRTEQGIGLHPNALITFDLRAIRAAGLLSPSASMRFVVDRAGLNDPAIGHSDGSNIAVIVSKPQTDRSRFDSILAAQVNGQPAKIVEDDTLYKFVGDLPPPLKADGMFVSIDIEIPPEATFLTIVATAADVSGKGPSIHFDHVVLSGARLVYRPEADAIVGGPQPAKPAELAWDVPKDREKMARMLSKLLDEPGLLGMPASETAPLLEGDSKQRFERLRDETARLEAAAGAIAVPKAHTITEGSDRDLKIYLAGDPKRQGAVAPRKFPSAWSGPAGSPFPSGVSGRRELAEAIASAENPLTARVIVNRIWAGHFGTGLVRTLNNFGELGDRPSHPELLDRLATDFVRSGWSLKGLHRRIVLSGTYRQSSLADSSAAREIDPENRLLWRMNRRRLEIEPWRDAVLTISGELDRSVGGASVPLDDATRRRTLYGFVSRHRLNDLLRLFDFPDPNITAGERSVTTVPLQQLFVLNSEFMIRQARAFAARLERERPTVPERIDHAFRLTYGRVPTTNEQAAAMEFVASAPTSDQDRLSPLEQFCLALLGTNELAYLD